MSRKPGRIGKHSVRQLFGTGLTGYSARNRFHPLLIEQLEHRTLLNAAPVLTPGETSPAIGTIDEDHAFVVSLTDSFINNGAVTSTTITDEDAGDEVGGIAIVGLTGQGTWEYSLDDGATFQGVGDVSESEALLLPKTAQLRYTPDAQHGETPTITYRAWDRSGSHEAGAKVDTTTNGDATPFSTATDTATLTVTAVNDAPQNILPGTTPVTDEDTELVFTSSNCIQISDVDAGTNAIEVRLNATHGTLKLSATDGASYVGNESSFVTLTGTVSAINEALKTMIFRPEANFNGSGEAGASVEIETDDLGNAGAGGEQTTTNLMRITVNAVNDAPVNDVPATNVTEEDMKLVFSGDTQISISDVDAGDNPIQVTLTATHGKLRLSGTTGLTFSVGDGLDDATMTFTGKLSDINGALDGLEFTPASNYSGQATLTLTTNDKGHTGSGELTDTDTTTITITPVNDAPVLNGTGSPTLTEIDDNETSNTGNTVQEILNSVSSLDMITDADASAVEGIAVYAYSASAGSNTATLGKWQYSLTASDGTTGTWLDLPSDVSINSALLLRAQDRLRFMPYQAGSGTATISFRAWDQTGSTSGKQGTKVDAQASVGGSSAFSTATETASIKITTTNSAPVLNNSWNPALAAIALNATSNTGTLVKDLIASVGAGNDMITDADANALEGLAILSVDNTNGRWQYSTDGVNFTDFTSTTGSVVSLGAVARLLAANDTTRIRFVPNSGFAGQIGAGITFRAWDQTSGTNGGTADTSTNGGSTAFSTATETASISVGQNGSIAGRVFVDANNNGKFDTGEIPLAYVRITLTRTDTTGDQTTRTTLTDANGAFLFEDLPAGTYRLSEDQPAGFIDGKHWQDGNTSVDTSENDVFKGITLTAGQTLTGYSFGELGLLPQYFSKRLLLSTAPACGSTAWNSMFAEIRAVAEDQAGNSDIANLLRNGPPSTPNTAPTIQSQTFSVAENSAAGTIVGTVAASDPDAGQTLSYAIVGGNTNGVFAIDSAGHIKVAKSELLDFETTPSYLLKVRVIDSGSPSLSAEATIVVNLTNVNEAPVIEDETFTISEHSAAGTVVGALVATDVDRPHQTLSYAIVEGDANGVFTINSSGKLTVASPNLLDYETTPTFTLKVRVTDSGSPSLSDEATITVNVTDGNDPPVVTSATFTLLEHSPVGTVVGTVSATDPNPATQTLTYAIIGGNTDDVFAINSSTGQLTVAKQNPLDYETHPVYTLKIRVSDNGSPSLSSEGTITVNLIDGNDPPVVTSATFTLLEHSDEGTVVGTVAATDANPANPIFTYAIVGGDPNGVFAIDAATGQITVANRDLLDYETAKEHAYLLIIRVTDNGSPPLSSEATITVNVTDGNDPPVVEDQEFDIDENSLEGTIVGYVGIFSPNPGEEFDYEIVATDANLPFEIDSTGQLEVKAGATLNYEIADRYTFTVKVSDKVDPQLFDTATITVLVNNMIETAPVIADKTFTVDEDLTVGADLGSLEAADADPGQTLTYSIIEGAEGLPFEIDGNGHLRLKAPLDYETTASYTFTVQVTDPDNLTDTAEITVTVNDVNEAPVIEDQTFGVDEDVAGGTVIGTLEASDPDAGATLSYAIVGGDDLPFEIGASGQLLLKAGSTLDFETTASYTFTVEVSDGALTDTAEITVTVNDVNEAPVIEDQTFSVNEDAAAEAVVGTLTASDPDAGATLTYAIQGDTMDLPFTVDARGQVTVAVADLLDYETMQEYTFVVKVTDQDGLSDEATITVTVNEYANVASMGGFAFLAASPTAPESVDAAFGEEDSWYDAGWDETL